MKSAAYSSGRLPAQLNIPATLAVALMEAAAKAIRLSLQEVRRERQPRRGETRYGEKARLARILRLPRQRVHELLRSRRHLPDAERTLLLLIWLQARSEGRDLA